MKTRKTKKRRVRKDRIIFVIMVSFLLFSAIYMLRTTVDFNSKPETGASTKSAINLIKPQNIEKTYVWGIDISRWNVGSVNGDFFKNAREADCKFVYIQFGRTTKEGFADFSTTALDFAEQAELAELPFGFYFLTDAKTEYQRINELKFISNFLNTVNKKYYQFNKLPLMLDHEEYGELDNSAREEQLSYLIADLDYLNYETIVYTSYSRFNSLKTILDPKQKFWIADYSYYEEGVAPTEFPKHLKEEKNIVIWQYTADDSTMLERGLSVYNNITGKNESLDRNIMYSEFYSHYCE